MLLLFIDSNRQGEPESRAFSFRADSTQIFPPCIWTIFLAIERPSPVPPFSRVLERVHLVKFLEDPFLVYFRKPGAGVGNGNQKRPVGNRWPPR